MCKPEITVNPVVGAIPKGIFSIVSRSNMSIVEVPGSNLKGDNASVNLLTNLRDYISSGSTASLSSTYATSPKELYSTDPGTVTDGISFHEKTKSVWNATLSSFMAWNTGAYLEDWHTTAAPTATPGIVNGPQTPRVLQRTTTDLSDLEKFWNELEQLKSVTMDNISQTAWEWYDDFEHVSESYILTSVAAFGILMNILAIVIISWDRRMWPMSRILHNLFLFSEQIFLGLVIAFLQLRAYFLRHNIPRDDWRRLELVNYLTTFVGAAQTFAAWMLYIVATDAYRSVRQLTISEKIFQIRRAPLYVVGLILIVGGFYSAYLPPVRVEFFKFANETGYNLCNIPIENHWDFKYDEVPSSDLYYILYYSVGYTFFAYVLPFFMICCRDKDIIDILHDAQEQKALLPSRAYVLCPALGVSVACNVYLVCVALKMVILTFKIFEYVNDYVKGAFVFFRYLNVYSNFLQVLKSSLHFFILMIYNKRLRKIVLDTIRRKRTELQ